MTEITRMWNEIMLDDQEPALCDFEDVEKGTEENTTNDAMKVLFWSFVTVYYDYSNEFRYA